MNRQPPYVPTKDNIESKAVFENEFYEFKDGSVVAGLDKDNVKAAIVDDVVAFLNAENVGHCILGVKENKQGEYHAWSPLTENHDKLGRRVVSILLDSIAPKPTGLSSAPIDLDGGYALDLRIAQHRMQPYQNKLTGGFKIRSGLQNATIPRDELGARFKRFEDYRDRLEALRQREDARAQASDLLRAGAPLLNVSILPREHFEQGPEFTDSVPGGGRCSFGDYYHGGGCFWLSGCEDGREAFDGDLERMFVGDDWFIHAAVVHPFEGEEGHIDFSAFERSISAFLEGIEFRAKHLGVKGPFLIRLEVANLQSERVFATVFAGQRGVSFISRRLTETITDAEVVHAFVDKVTSAYRRGGLRPR